MKHIVSPAPEAPSGVQCRYQATDCGGFGLEVVAVDDVVYRMSGECPLLSVINPIDFSKQLFAAGATRCPGNDIVFGDFLFNQKLVETRTGAFPVTLKSKSAKDFIGIFYVSVFFPFSEQVREFKYGDLTAFDRFDHISQQLGEHACHFGRILFSIDPYCSSKRESLGLEVADEELRPSRQFGVGHVHIRFELGHHGWKQPLMRID